MGAVIDMAQFRLAKTPSAPPPAVAMPPARKPSRARRKARTGQADNTWEALERSGRFSPGVPVSPERREAVLALLEFKFPTNIVVDDDGREYISDFSLHERARVYFRLFGFDIDFCGDADAMYELWERLDLLAEYVRIYLANPHQFCDTMAAGMPDDWFDYVTAIARQDHERAARLCYILDIDPYTRPWRNR